MNLFVACYGDCYSSKPKIFSLYSSIEQARKVIMKDILSITEADTQEEQEILNELMKYNCYEPDQESCWMIRQYTINGDLSL